MTRNTFGFGLFYAEVLEFKIFGKTCIIQDLKRFSRHNENNFMSAKHTKLVNQQTSKWLSCF